MSESSGKRSLRSRKKETLCTSCNQSISEAEKLANDRNGTEMICGDCALDTIEETIAETKPKKRSPRSKISVVEIGNSVVKEITTQVPVNATENDQNDANIRATPNNAANTGMQSTQPTQARKKIKKEVLSDSEDASNVSIPMETIDETAETLRQKYPTDNGFAIEFRRFLSETRR